MIKKIECYVPVCDVCGKLVDDGAEFIAHFDTEAEASEHALERDEYGGSGGQMVGNQLCCAGCWCYDDDDEIVVRPAQTEGVRT